MRALEIPRESTYRRHDFRVPVTAVATIHAARGSGSFRIENLSAHGALLRPHTGQRPEHETTLVLHLLVAGAGRFRVACRVVRETLDGAFAVVFTEGAELLQDMIQDEALAYLESLEAPRTIVVDLDRTRRQRIAGEVCRLGGRAIEVSTPLEALGILQQSTAHITAIIVAESLTQTGGDELLDFVRVVYPDVRQGRL